MINYFYEAEGLNNWIADKRHTLHRRPELGFELPETRAFLLKTLSSIGVKARVLECGGLLATLGKKEGRCILLRADMDALPMEEKSGVSFRSEKPGCMHSCGHDTHMAMLLGAIEMLKRHEDTLNGQVLCCFEPAEEIMRGAEAVIKELPRTPDFAFALHIFTTDTEENGYILCPEGAHMSSSDVFCVKVRGKSGHGSDPHTGINPLYPAMEMARSFVELLSNEKDPRDAGALSVCQFQGGNAHNIIPEECCFKGTLRMLNEEARKNLHKRMGEIVEGISLADRVQGELSFEDSVPALINDPFLAGKAQGYLSAVAEGIGPLEHRRNLVSEDFACFGRTMPLVLFELLSRSPEGAHYPGHNPRVLFDDSILYRGAAAYAQVAQDYLNEFSNEEGAI